MFQTPLNLFRTLAFAEAVSWTILIAALILRAVTDISILVTVGGSIHGFVFLSYGATAILVAKNQRWHPGVAFVAIISAVIPYATIPTEIWLHRTRRLSGEWRKTATDDPRDQAWHDRLMRWALAHPVLLGVLILLAVIALFTILLIIGPPGGRH